MFNILKKQESRVLVIGDIHEPFTKEGYLEFCKEQYKKWKCNQVVFIGDIIDNHYSSYHEQDPDGKSAGDELDLAIDKIKRWYKAFPEATIIIGNHDRIVSRKVFSSGLSKKWIKNYQEVLGTPGWNFKDYHRIDDVLYIHGEGGTARMRIKNEFESIVQGHLHTQCYIDWVINDKARVFGMQVGCGIDYTSYAMGYAKLGRKPAIACGVVINGRVPINIIMD
jgi:predicted phosphodiesterase